MRVLLESGRVVTFTNFVEMDSKYVSVYYTDANPSLVDGSSPIEADSVDFSQLESASGNYMAIYAPENLALCDYVLLRIDRDRIIIGKRS